MKSLKKSAIVGTVAVATMLGLVVVTGGSAIASTHASTSKSVISHKAKKTLVCYKAKSVKKIKAVKPKCPKGWTAKKPIVKKTTSASKTSAFSGTYKGTISMLWSSSDVKVTSLTGTGSGTDLGLSKVTATGKALPTDQCVPINATGSLSGANGTLNLALNASSRGCAADSAAPTVVSITGTAVVTGGTGKFAGATGSLKVTGSFMIKSTSAGSNESDAFTVTLTGSLTLK